MSRFGNEKKGSFLESIPRISIETEDNDLASRCKFNFSYFDVQPAGQAFGDWDHAQLVDLLEKLKEYCKCPLRHWENQRIGKSGRVLSIYGGFPGRSDFSPPRHVPFEARWGRFRVAQSVRLVGFVLASDLDGRPHRCGHSFCSNTFYVVFLDRDHRFYKTEDA